MIAALYVETGGHTSESMTSTRGMAGRKVIGAQSSGMLATTTGRGL